MAGKKSQQVISLVDFVILQFFYAFQTIYEGFTSILKWDFWQKDIKAIDPPEPTTATTKRHFIQLYKPDPQEGAEQPQCYINVIEFDNSRQEEEIRKRKRSYDFPMNRGAEYQRHQRTRSENEIQRFYCSNLRY
ncbi:uncharacterized protein LOC126741347 [Anthonomus grandis grandis]|uniref:uncharacterized protein LOC126741347 n=1 Tax=Anthonomus grandis grandis TaxID=2921223 RepID=UPI002166ADF7|nr:uncharacterized protein LOC126741347 [Anthonomus grandis grandis]XP_050303700.1 uncharacterized protein LOC126741347 [Anthonomus grandis grandis]